MTYDHPFKSKWVINSTFGVGLCMMVMAAGLLLLTLIFLGPPEFLTHEVPQTTVKGYYTVWTLHYAEQNEDEPDTKQTAQFLLSRALDIDEATTHSGLTAECIRLLAHPNPDYVFIVGPERHPEAALINMTKVEVENPKRVEDAMVEDCGSRVIMRDTPDDDPYSGFVTETYMIKGDTMWLFGNGVVGPMSLDSFERVVKVAAAQGFLDVGESSIL